MSMVSILATKLYIPQPRLGAVPRERLIMRLNAGLSGRLTLVSAPAGFGKTTLVSSWLRSLRTGQQEASAQQIAWFSLDNGDNDPARFLMHFVAALQTIAPQVGAGVIAALQSPQPPPAEMILTELLNELASVPNAIVVLDDYHAIEADSVDQALTFLVDHLPPQIHLVIATREDPSLPLARLRVRSDMSELRATDLRFTISEAREFLNQTMALSLSEDAIAALESRTEGWIAGLQLAALSLQGQQNAAGFIESFTGSHRFVLDYLVEEVLHQQPEHIQRFLLRTSILDRMCGPLCDAVLDESKAFATKRRKDEKTKETHYRLSAFVLRPSSFVLQDLERANLFLVPLDNERRWYRYHHLFGDLLRQRLQQNVSPDDPTQIAELHIRASEWFEDNGLAIEAFQHAAAANDIERAERLMDGKGMPLHFYGAVNAILGWLSSLPESALDARPSLWVKYAEIMVVNGQTTGVEPKLQAAETALGGVELDETIRNLIGHIAAVRSTLALTRYQIDEMMFQSRRALEYLRPDDLPFRATANWSLGFAYQLMGDRAAAHRALADAVSFSERAGNIFTTILATIGLGQLQEGDNQLHRAAETFRHVLALAGDRPQQIIYEAYLGLARIFYEWNDLDTAERHSQQSIQLAHQYESVIDRFIVCELFLVRIRLARGDLAGASALLAQTSQSAQQRNYLHRFPDVAAVQVLVLLQQGKLAAAAHIAQTHQLPMSQARVLLAQGDPVAALAILEPLRQEAKARSWHDERLKTTVLEAIARYRNRETTSALHLLSEALTLAEPDSFIRIFVDEGEPMKQLLQQFNSRGQASDYAKRVLAAFSPDTRQIDQSALIEPLSERELEVLQHMAEGRSDQQIADRLILSLYTVKVHARNIYGKLGVNKRMLAVARARELGLLPHL